MKYLDPQELCEFGYLQEVNRQFFHSLGLALEINDQLIIQVQDHRDDPEGMVFSEGTMSFEKSQRVSREFAEHAVRRNNALGWTIQDPPFAPTAGEIPSSTPNEPS